MRDKLTIMSSFKGGQDRIPIYTENYNKFSKSLPKEVDIFINDSSDEKLASDNKKMFHEHFSNLTYFHNSLTLLESWIFLLKQIKTPYVFTVFDDQYLHNITDKKIENCLEFIEQEDFDVMLFLRYSGSRVEGDTLYVTNHHTDRISRFKEKEVEIGGQTFCVVNNNNAQFKYSFFVNNAIYKREYLLKQLEFYASKYSGPKSAHNAELNHQICPNEIRNNKIGVCLTDEIFDLDLGFNHVVGIRQVDKDSILNFKAVTNNYDIKVI